MGAHRAATIRASVRSGLVAVALAAAMWGTAAIPVSAATVGATGAAIACAPGLDTIQLTSTGASYAVPTGGGQLTDWSTQSGPETGPAALLVWRPTAVAGTYTLVGVSPFVALTPNAMNTTKLAAPIGVQAGDLLGVRTQGMTDCLMYSTAGNSIGYYNLAPLAAAGGSEAFTTHPRAFDLNVSVTVGAGAPAPTPGGGNGEGNGNGNGESGGGDNHQDPGDSGHATPAPGGTTTHPGSGTGETQQGSGAGDSGHQDSGVRYRPEVNFFTA